MEGFKPQDFSFFHCGEKLVQQGINWKYGDIHIGKDVFIGMNTIISKPCTIGNGAIIGAGSVVTKDIPANEIWAGNPARFIKKR